MALENLAPAPGHHASVSRGDRHYWIRRLVFSGKQQTVSVPREVLNMVNAPPHAFFMMWVEDGDIRIRLVDSDGRLPCRVSK